MFNNQRLKPDTGKDSVFWLTAHSCFSMGPGYRWLSLASWLAVA
jgi:hypothetical protein